MIRHWIALAALSSLPLTAVAQNAGQPSEHEQHAAQSSGEAAAGERSMPGTHEQMQAMREQMARIHATEDPEERQRLMNEHMQSMQERMRMMGRMEQAEGGGDAPQASRCAQGDMQCRMQELQSQHGMMQQRMGTMQQRMGEMQQLMEQMVEHLRAATEDQSRRERRR